MFSNFSDLTGLHCFSCMDLAVIGMTGSLPDDVSLRDVVAQSMFGTDPGSCHNPVLTRCADDQACFSGNMYSEGHSKNIPIIFMTPMFWCIKEPIVSYHKTAYRVVILPDHILSD